MFFYIPTISKNKGYENLAASIDPKSETINQSYSKDFDSSEAPTFLGSFKLPVPPVVRRPQTITSAAVGVLPVAKFVRLRRPTGKGKSGLKGASLDFLEHFPPKPESACFTVLCFPPTLLTLTGGCPPNTFFWRKLI